MPRENVSSWIRQLRYRAKKHNLYNELTIEEVHAIIQSYDNMCAFCKADYETLDTCFPLKDNAPNVQANIIPLCRACKERKKNHDLFELLKNGTINNKTFSLILKKAFKQNHGDVFRNFVRALSGYIDGN